jgi:hypothetical protein
MPDLLPSMDPRSPVVEDGAETSEFQLARLGLILSTAVTLVSILGAVVLIALDKAGAEVFLAVLPGTAGMAMAGYATGQYAKARGRQKQEAIRGASDIAVAEVTGLPPAGQVTARTTSVTTGAES